MSEQTEENWGARSENEGFGEARDEMERRIAHEERIKKLGQVPVDTSVIILSNN